MEYDLNGEGTTTIKRCSKCILPYCYRAITFNNDGVCSHCISYEKAREKQYLGDSALITELGLLRQNREDANKDYDCVLGLSGGRDSSYLLYYLVKILGIRVLAFTVDNGFVSEQAMRNMKKATEILGVKFVIEQNDLLKRCIRHTLSSWMHRPSLGMIEVLCTGCRLGMIKGTLAFTKKNRIPVIISGGTPFETMSYRTEIMKANMFGGKLSLILGYLVQIAKNPRWIMHYTYMMTQIREFFYYFYNKEIASKSNIPNISPFGKYMRWQEKEVLKTIKNELDWREDPDIKSTWRTDCDIASLKLYLYKYALGFNDKDVILSNLIRDNQLSREEALERLKTEGEVPENVVGMILDKFGFSFSDFRNNIAKLIQVKT